MDKSSHSLAKSQHSTEESDKEVCQKLPQNLEASNESLTDSSAIENEDFTSCISFKDLRESETALATTNTHSNKDVKNTLNCSLSQSETDCLNHLNDMIASASGNRFESNVRNVKESLVERVCYELKSNSNASRDDLSHQTTIESSGTSLESSQTTDGIENSSVQKSTDNAETVSDLNMSAVDDDRIKATFVDECLYKVNDACGIKTCSQHEMDEKKSEASEGINKVDKVTVSQDQIENTHIVDHDDSVNDMKAIVCQVLRTWAERQSVNVNVRHPHASVSEEGIESAQNVTNVREYVKKIEGSFTEPSESIKDNCTNNKNELYTNILQKVLAEDDNEHVQEVREETLQLMNATDNEEEWKLKFHEILHMFQDLANKMKISQNSSSNKHGKCFNYMNGPPEGKFD